jgi:putative RNA 2'-phosphotransferase
MTEEKDLIRKSKHLAFLLRHDTEYQFDEHGWRDVKDLIKNHGYMMAELEDIVANNDKQRYEFNTQHTKIRARQGHSINVDVELQENVPPDILYHGTATRFLSSIYDKGILGETRQYVHLSPTKEIATKVGSRHGKPYVLGIDCKRMVSDGIKFYLSRNGVWLTKYVDPKYLLTI